VIDGEYSDWTDGRQTVTIRFPLDAASVQNRDRPFPQRLILVQ